jgi:hypothetical protein
MEAPKRAPKPGRLTWPGRPTLAPCVRMAGPLLDESGNMVGSVFLIEADDLAAAKAIHAQDPYVTEGVFGHVHINETRWAIGEGKPE